MLGGKPYSAAAYSACLWGNWFAIANAVANLCSLGVMHNGEPSGPICSGGERCAVLVNIVAAQLGVVLLLAGRGRR